MSEVIYQIKKLVKNYSMESQTLHILKGLNFTVSRGSAICIMGPSGSGKSTLLNLMGALDQPSSGEILYYGRDISNWTEDQKAFFRRDKIGFVFQSHYLLKEFTVLENISLPAYVAKKSKKKLLERAHFLADTLGLKERTNHYPSQLSGGESQRVAVARALMNEPEILLADEPVGNLDRKNGIIIRDLFLDLQKRFNLTLLTVSHDSFFAGAFSRIVKLEDGCLSESV
ncbi:MAG: ABC transporter ATP-binding protein [Bdellovibrionaceae bacterium]|nr:ABC transporter ATP-binding protein [Pseudobdellovibrionaceae bacterium]